MGSLKLGNLKEASACTDVIVHTIDRRRAFIINYLYHRGLATISILEFHHQGYRENNVNEKKYRMPGGHGFICFEDFFKPVFRKEDSQINSIQSKPDQDLITVRQIYRKTREIDELE